MGCFICNILEISARVPYEKCIQCAKVYETNLDEAMVREVKEEICNDIAVCHPEMVKRIMEIVREYKPNLCKAGK